MQLKCDMVSALSPERTQVLQHGYLNADALIHSLAQGSVEICEHAGIAAEIWKVGRSNK